MLDSVGLRLYENMKTSMRINGSSQVRKKKIRVFLHPDSFFWVADRRGWPLIVVHGELSWPGCKTEYLVSSSWRRGRRNAPLAVAGRKGLSRASMSGREGSLRGVALDGNGGIVAFWKGTD